MEENKYVECYVAYLDILGFKKFVETKPFESINSLLSDYNNKDKILQLLGINKCEVDDTLNELEVLHFSDSIVISIPTKYMYAFDVLLTVISRIIIDCFYYHNLLLRGGIAKGDFFINSEKVFGNALIKAYQLESLSAIYPRVIFTEKLLEDYRGTLIGSMLCESAVRIDSDEFMFVDFLSYLDWQQRFDTKFVFEKYNDFNQKIENEYKKVLCEDANNNIREKYIWLKKYYENSIIEFKKLDSKFPKQYGNNNLQ